MLDCELECGSCDSLENSFCCASSFIFSGIRSKGSGAGVGSSSLCMTKVLLQVGHLGVAPADK